MNTNYFFLADTKKGLVEISRMINFTLEEAKEEAIRLEKELHEPIVIVTPVWDTRDV